MKIPHALETQKINYAQEIGGYALFEPDDFGDSQITSYQKPQSKSWSISSILKSIIETVKRWLGFKTLSFYPSEWIKDNVALSETPKEDQIESFWRMVWYADTAAIVSFSHPTADESKRLCIYWPVYLGKPLDFKDSKMHVVLVCEENEYAYQDQLLIKRTFILRKDDKRKEIMQLIAFPDATQSTINAAVAAVKNIDKNKTLLALYSGDSCATKAFLAAYSA